MIYRAYYIDGGSFKKLTLHRRRQFTDLTLKGLENQLEEYNYELKDTQVIILEYIKPYTTKIVKVTNL